jgi:3-hydroxyisobutyrate dehydrogenase
VRIAVLGTGTMGKPIAENLARAGYDVVVWNRTRAKAEAVQGATVADTPADTARGADAVLTMLTDGAAVEAAVRGIDSLPLWLQLSTVGIDATERLMQLAEAKGATFVDAPVLGTKEPAEKGELVVFASGPNEARALCEPIFDVIGRKTIWVGEAGAGTRLKLVVNNWLLAIVAGLAETLALARALDLDPRHFVEAISGGSLDVPYAQVKGRAMLEESFPPSFALRLAHKDANLVLDAARRAGLDLRVAAAVADELARADELGHGDEDLAAVYLAVKPVAVAR